MMHHKYTSLHYIITHAEHILLIAHSRPDPDTIGANVALYSYITSLNASVTLTCHDPFPSVFDSFLPNYTLTPIENITLSDFDVVIGCDNIDRGFGAAIDKLNHEKHVTVGIDHHPHTTITPDLLITKPEASSTCEILYDFFAHVSHEMSPTEASALTIGILGDTRLFHNPNTSPHTIEVVAELLANDAPLPTIAQKTFLTKRLATLRLWGTALRNARRLASDALVSVITATDIASANIPKEELKEEIKEVTSLLCSVPHVPFAIVLMQLDKNIIKGSIRAEADRNTDVSAIAALFGGGGHKLASGFEVTGTLQARGDTWRVV